MDQAESDLKSAQGMMENHSYDWACFAFQQSAEKALKAFLYEQGEEWERKQA
jgi:HEPN domain-containing protein